LKKIKIIALVLILLAMALPVWAVGTVTQAISQVCDDSGRNCNRIIRFTCTGDADGGTYPATAISTYISSQLAGWYLYYLRTNPGTTAPTDNWDFTITDAHGIDVLGGAGANRHTTTSQEIVPLLGSSPFAKPFTDTWTLNVSGSTVNSAVIVIDATFVWDPK